MPTCQTCRYFHRLINPNNLAAQQGECRFRPPHPFPISTPTGQIAGAAAMFPVVQPDNWCGQHQPKDT